MADSSGRSIIGARRVPSTSLNEDYYTFVRSGGGTSSGAPGPGSGSYQHSLRPAESRFSLREQFSTTRREIEFGFDDTSSILERSTLASEADFDNGFDDNAVVVNDASSSFLMPPPPRPAHSTPPIQRSHYELLCLPNDPSLTPNDIRRAFHRVVQNLCVDRQPRQLQVAAASYLGQAQIAFETLIEPYRRAEYDMSLADREGHSLASSTLVEDAATYQAAVLEQYVLLGPGGLRTTTDLGMRVDTTSVLSTAGRQSTRNDGLPAILDLSLGQSITTDLPALQEPLEQTVTYLRDLYVKNLQLASLPTTKRPVYRVHPTLTIAGSAHGLMDEPLKTASILRDRYQPPGPSIHGARRLDQLLTSRFLPELHITARQELFVREQNKLNPENTPAPVPLPFPPPLEIPDSVLEQELEILPLPSVTLRAGHSIKFPEKDQEPVNVEVSIQKPLLGSASQAPTLGVALDKKIGSGTAFLVADAGDWDRYVWPAPRECRELSKFSEMSSSSSGIRYIQQKMNSNNNSPSIHGDPFRNAPSVEIGYAFGRHAEVMGVRAGSSRAFTRPSARGLRGMDDQDVSGHCRTGSAAADDGRGSWTVSTGLTFGTAAAYLRYGKDLFTGSRCCFQKSAGPQTINNSKYYVPVKKSGFRTEIELAAATPTTSFSRSLTSIFSSGPRARGGGSGGGGDILLAFRTLKYIGRFTKIGFEVGVTANNLHLSLYWSRLGQRVSIPFLIAATGTTAGGPRTVGVSGKLVFWTTVVPFAAVALWEGFLRRRQRWWSAWKDRGQKEYKNNEKEERKTGQKKEKAKRVVPSGGGGGSGGEDITFSQEVARQRAEADELTVILATGVENRQRIERQRGGLVILSAKYGVLSGFIKGQPQPQPQPQPQLQSSAAGGRGGNGEDEIETENEIADVTVALAAIVDEQGRIHIPAGLNKGRLLGFWDPAPTSSSSSTETGTGRKTLWIRYLYRGKESVVEVGEGEGICLP